VEVSSYGAVYEKQFVRNLQRYSSLKERIRKKAETVLDDPYRNTETLADAAGRLNLKGCRSVRIDRNFRIVFVICEECRAIPECEFCFCDDLPDKTVIFLTVAPHDKAYSVK
jgi:mRNA-degrading endonuclease RelE of RelBE toxin-antitoxin system